uniref:Uncharacterized protein n=1 Tax=Cacopsylla melanoneura TaxID=428564 RepID=A0A8D8TIS7_9HEMI
MSQCGRFEVVVVPAFTFGKRSVLQSVSLYGRIRDNWPPRGRVHAKIGLKSYKKSFDFRPTSPTRLPIENLFLIQITGMVFNQQMSTFSFQTSVRAVNSFQHTVQT